MIFRKLFIVFCITGVVAFASDSNTSKSVSSETAQTLDEVYTLIENSNYKDAKKKLTKSSSKAESDNADYYYIQRAFGYIALHEGNYKEAASFLKAALQGEVFSDEVKKATSIDFAQTLYASGQLSEAVTILKPLLINPKDSLQGSKILGAALLELDRNKEALPYLLYAYSTREKRTLPDTSLGLSLSSAYIKLRQFDQAQKYFNELVTAYPNDSELWQQQAILLYQADKPKLAAALLYLAYQKELLNTSADAIKLLAQLQAQAGSVLIGISILEESFDSGSIKRTKETTELLAQLHVMAQNYSTSAKLYEELHNKWNGNVTYLLQSSQLYLEAKMYAKAKRIARSIVATKKSKKASTQAKQILDYVTQFEGVT